MRKFGLGILILVLTALLHRFVPSIVNMTGWNISDVDKFALDKGLDVILWGGWTLIVCLVVRVLLWKLIVGRATKGNTPELIKQLVDFLIITLSIILASSFLFGQNVVAAVTALGAVGIVISFGIKDLIQDLMTGLAINLEMSFALGDWVSVQDGQVGRISGQVVQINWRTTHLQDVNLNYFIVPNREIGNSTITVFSNPTSLVRQEVMVELDYVVPEDDAKRLLLTAVMSVLGERGFSDHPRPDVLISNFPSNGIEYKVRFWIYVWEQITPDEATNVVMTSIMRHLRLHGISPSYSKLEHFKVPAPDLFEPPDLQTVTPNMLSSIGFFEPLTSEESEYLAKQGEQKFWPLGAKLLRQGDEGNSMFIIMQGLVKVNIKDEHGHDMCVGQIQAGELFGEMSLLTGEPRSATIEAATPVNTLEITQDIIEKLLENRPELGERLSEMMALRQQKSADVFAASQQEETQSLKTAIYDKMRKIFKLP